VAEAGRAGTVVVAHPGAELYGSDRMALESMIGLVERGWRVVLAVPTAGPLVTEARQHGVEVELLDSPVLRKSLLRPLALAHLLGDSGPAARRIGELLRRVRPDVVYVSTISIPLWIARARLLRIPVVCHVHQSERGASRLVRGALAHPIGLANRVVVNSAFTRDSLLEVVPSLEPRTTVVYNGVVGPGRVVPPRERLDGRMRLLCVGRVSPAKGVDVAVEALGRLVADGLDAELEIVGDVLPGYEWFLEALKARSAALGLADRVVFSGFRPEVWTAVAEADMVLAPARDEEPFGISAVEAVLAGRPVAVSAVGGLAEAVAGFVSAIPVTPSDPAALAAAVARVAASWTAFRRTALAMAPMAADRYRPDRYRDAISRELRLAAEEPAPTPLVAQAG
jgi:glycosyltransferase involved in cell wall biosynthesis